MGEKVTGWAFLTVGVLVIGIAAVSVYMIFTGQAEPFSLFNFKGVSVPLSALMGTEVPSGIELPEIEIFPGDVLNDTSNTLAHLFLMGFMVSVGYKIASLGINLLRPIIVKMEKKVPSVLDPIEKR